jgi:hypothetical protein
MTPEREAEIRALPLKSVDTVDLLAEIDRTRNEMEIWVGRTNDLQENFDVYYEKYEDLKAAAKHVTTVFHDERKGDLRLAMDSLSVALEGK